MIIGFYPKLSWHEIGKLRFGPTQPYVIHHKILGSKLPLQAPTMEKAKWIMESVDSILLANPGMVYWNVLDSLDQLDKNRQETHISWLNTVYCWLARKWNKLFWKANPQLDRISTK